MSKMPKQNQRPDEKKPVIIIIMGLKGIYLQFKVNAAQ